MNDRAASSEFKQAWWLDPGTEQCVFCEAALHDQALVYCVVCDRPVCPLCRMGDDDLEEALCPECSETQTGGEG